MRWLSIHQTSSRLTRLIVEHLLKRTSSLLFCKYTKIAFMVKPPLREVRAVFSYCNSISISCDSSYSESKGVNLIVSGVVSSINS